MATVDSLQSSLIDKIKAIKNKQFLQALEKLITSGASGDELVELSGEQKAILEMSEGDIKAGRFISQEAMNKRNLEWLNEMYITR